MSKGTSGCAILVIPEMVKQGGGSIVLCRHRRPARSANIGVVCMFKAPSRAGAQTDPWEFGRTEEYFSRQRIAPG